MAVPILVAQQAGKLPTAVGQPSAEGITSNHYASGQLSLSQIVREIDDPSSHARWLLVRDPEHPGGPGRLLLVDSALTDGEARPRGSILGGPTPAHPVARPALARSLSATIVASSVALPPPLQPVIRSGESLIVEEHTAVVDARLEAVALGMAAPGGTLEVRLKIGGKLLRAVALSPGRARLATEGEARP